MRGILYTRETCFYINKHNDILIYMQRPSENHKQTDFFYIFIDFLLLAIHM